MYTQLLHGTVRRESAGLITPSLTSASEDPPSHAKEYENLQIRQRLLSEREIKAEPHQEL